MLSKLKAVKVMLDIHNICGAGLFSSI